MKQILGVIAVVLVGVSALAFAALFLLGIMVLLNGWFFPDPGYPRLPIADVIWILALAVDAAVVCCHIVAIKRIAYHTFRKE